MKLPMSHSARPRRPARTDAVRCTARASLLGAVASLVGLAVLAGCAGGNGSPPTPVTNALEAPREWITPFPHVRVDVSGRIVEFDGEVPIDPHDRETPLVYLEVAVCSRNSREYEALVVTDALPSHVHAALLLMGIEPGKPGGWRRATGEGRATPTAPTGPPLDVTLIYTARDGVRRAVDPAAWIIDVRTRRSLRDRAGLPDAPWIFAGSTFAPRPDGPGEYYKADIEGTLIGLATFGTETIAWPGVFSPEASVQAPEWIADDAQVPPVGTKVTVRVHARETAGPTP